MFEDVPEHDQSEFNSNIAYLIRLDSIIKEIDLYTKDQNYTGLYHGLITFFKELLMVFNEKEEDKLDPLYSAAKQAYINIRDAKLKGRTSISMHDIDALHAFDITLRKLMQARGLGISKKTDSRYALSSKS